MPDGLGLQEGQQTPQARVRGPVLGPASSARASSGILGTGILSTAGPAANTRFTFPAASRSSSARSAGAAPVRSIALTSWCAASTGASSPSRPVSTLTTPPGTSEVASTSARLTAASTAGPLTASTAALPVAMTGASTLTSPSSPASGGARTATTPVGSGTLRLKYGPATALGHGTAFGVVGAKQRGAARPGCREREFPAEVGRVLDGGVHPLAGGRGIGMGGVPGQITAAPG